jgi:anti-anti-sigma regulatory factor
MKELPQGISVGCGNDVIHVRVVGRGTFQNSQPLRRFADEMIDSGWREFVFDLSQCQGMDSTFLGTLAGVALRLKHDARGGSIHVIHATASQRDLIHTLGLDRLFVVEADDQFALAHTPNPDEEFEQLPDTDLANLSHSATRDDVADLMLEAHDDLIRADASNRDRFSEVTRCLRERLAKRRASAQAPK